MDFTRDFLERLTKAKKVVFFTGAGISAESGIPTFRGKEGIWNKLKPEELASFDAFMKNPDMVWEWYQYRRKIVNEAHPNKGHDAIVSMEKYFESVTVVTQNVDNLHIRAGSKKVYELHGNIVRNYCVDCKNPYFATDEYLTSVPECKFCGGLIRPDVVWFGEFLPEDQFSGAEKAAVSCDICFVVGTSSVVYPAAYIPLSAKQNGALIVEVNIEHTELSRQADYTFLGTAGEILPAILGKIKELK